MTMVSRLAVLLALSCGTASAQAPGPELPTRATLAEQAVRRFPQSVRAGDLVGRYVLRPEEAQSVLGHVQSLTLRPDGAIDVIILEGTTLGLGGHPVAVPVEAVALLGEHVVLVGYTPGQLAALPASPPAAPLPPDTTVKVGLAKPSH